MSDPRPPSALETPGMSAVASFVRPPAIFVMESLNFEILFTANAVVAAVPNVTMAPSTNGRLSIIHSTPPFNTGIASWIIGSRRSVCNVLPKPRNWLSTVPYLISCISFIFPLTSENSSPTLVNDSTNFAFASSPIVPNAVAAFVSFFCWFVVFPISFTIASITSFCVARPSFHALKTFPVSEENISKESSIVPSASRVVTSFIASLILSRL